jgi:hypothetical protein
LFAAKAAARVVDGGRNELRVHGSGTIAQPTTLDERDVIIALGQSYMVFAEPLLSRAQAGADPSTCTPSAVVSGNSAATRGRALAVFPLHHTIVGPTGAADVLDMRVLATNDMAFTVALPHQAGANVLCCGLRVAGDGAASALTEAVNRARSRIVDAKLHALEAFSTLVRVDD